MIFLCAYPQIVVFWEVAENWRVVFEITPVHRPQCIGVEAELNERNRATSVTLKCSSDVKQFDWELWINAAMGLCKGLGELCVRLKEGDVDIVEVQEYRG